MSSSPSGLPAIFQDFHLQHLRKVVKRVNSGAGMLVGESCWLTGRGDAMVPKSSAGSCYEVIAIADSLRGRALKFDAQE